MTQNRPASSLSSVATVRRPQGPHRSKRTVEIEDFPLEAIPAPPAQFNNDDEAGENVALIRASPAISALKANAGQTSNGHATLLR